MNKIFDALIPWYGGMGVLISLPKGDFLSASFLFRWLTDNFILYILYHTAINIEVWGAGVSVYSKTAQECVGSGRDQLPV